MIVFRALQEQDFELLCKLTAHNEVGVTTLPHDKKNLKLRLDKAVKSFRNPDLQHECYYWFILEDLQTHTPLGVSGLITQVGRDTPFYAYKRVAFQNHCPSLNITHQDEFLEVCTDFKGVTELCTLFMHPNARALGLGRFLARARFLFIGQFPNYFSSRIIAELRGVSTPKGRSPFWDALNRHFFHMSFAKADKLTLNTNKQFIADLLPTHPIYVSLLSPSAQKVIGQPHEHTLPAMKILLHEGFCGAQFIDIFDGGPILENTVNKIELIKRMQVLRVKISHQALGEEQYMLSNQEFAGFRATLAEAKIEDGCVLISEQTAKGLAIQDGMKLNVVPNTYA